MSYVFLIIGFALLIKGADYFVEGSSRIATMLRVSPLLIGLTIVAFGTSSPEAAVSIAAALNGSADVAIGNVVGSNIFNITLVVGITAWILPLQVENDTIKKEIPFTLLGGIALYAMISDVWLEGQKTNLLTRTDGILLLLFFAIFMYYILEAARHNREPAPTGEAAKDSATTNGSGSSWPKNILFTLGGLAAIIIGGNLVVSGATDIALSFGMSETLAGLTIVAIGTSLPELVTSVRAAMKKETDIALGNIVGSSIFNIYFVLGATAVITPLALDSKVFVDMAFMVLLTLVLFVFSRTHYKINKQEGIILTITYVSYLVYIIIRN